MVPQKFEKLFETYPKAVMRLKKVMNSEQGGSGISREDLKKYGKILTAVGLPLTFTAISLAKHFAGVGNGVDYPHIQTPDRHNSDIQYDVFWDLPETISTGYSGSGCGCKDKQGSGLAEIKTFIHNNVREASQIIKFISKNKAIPKALLSIAGAIGFAKILNQNRGLIEPAVRIASDIASAKGYTNLSNYLYAISNTLGKKGSGKEEAITIHDLGLSPKQKIRILKVLQKVNNKQVGGNIFDDIGKGFKKVTNELKRFVNGETKMKPSQLTKGVSAVTGAMAGIAGVSVALAPLAPALAGVSAVTGATSTGLAMSGRGMSSWKLGMLPTEDALAYNIFRAGKNAPKTADRTVKGFAEGLKHMFGGGVKRKGSREEVWNGDAYSTISGLKKSDLMISKKGKIVSKRKHALGKKLYKNLK